MKLVHVYTIQIVTMLHTCIYLIIRHSNRQTGEHINLNSDYVCYPKIAHEASYLGLIKG